MNSEHNSPLLQIMIQCTMLRCNSTRGSTSHNVRDVELEEKDTEGGEKDKVQLDGLTDRVIVWLT